MPPQLSILNRRSAFTLIELLTVMAVLVLFMSLVAGLAPGASQSAKFNKNIVTLANLLEQARQAAVTQQSHVYVGYLSSATARTVLPEADKPGTYAAAFISQDGTDVLRMVSQADVGAGTLQSLGRVQKISSAEMEDELPPGNALAGTLDPQTASKPGTLWKVKARAGGSATPVVFDRIIKFTPQGAARVNGAPVESIELVIRPSHGGTASAVDEKQAGVIRINGLTGKIDIHQP